MFAMLQIVIGTGFFSVPPSVMGSVLIINVLSPFTWGLIWTFAGLLASPFAFVSRAGWDGYGFYVLLLPPAIWGVSFLLTAIAGQYPLGFEAGIRAAVLWGGYSAILVGVSRLVNAKDIVDGTPTSTMTQMIRRARNKEDPQA